MSFSHAVIWIDHQVAHAIEFNTDSHENSTITPRSEHGQVHQKAGGVGNGHVAADQHYLHEAAEAAADSNESPGSAKLELIKHISKHNPRIAEKVVGAETVDYPSDGRLLACAKKYLLRIDNLKPL